MTARWVACIGVVLGLGLAPAGSTARVPETPAVAATPSEQGGVARSARSQPGIFVRTLTVYGGRLWVGTFNEGLLVVDAWSPPEGLERARPLAAPFRMVNDVLEVNGSLYVAANEGLFVTSDGATFARVPQVGGRSVTSMAFDGRSLYATTTSALWRVRVLGRGPASAVWWRPAGSRSLQGVVAECGSVWLASEDRGAILFDGRRFTAYDRIAGLPTSWAVAVAGDGVGGVFEATLRDGAFHVDASGHWRAMQGLPSPWTLAVVRSEGEVCVGTQEGAACYAPASDGTPPWGEPRARIADLPDPRAHAFLAVQNSLLVGTEAGLAVVPRPL